MLLRAGNAGSNTVADHVTVLRETLAQLPGYEGGRRPGKNVWAASMAPAAPTD